MPQIATKLRSVGPDLGADPASTACSATLDLMAARVFGLLVCKRLLKLAGSSDTTRDTTLRTSSRHELRMSSGMNTEPGESHSARTGLSAVGGIDETTTSTPSMAERTSSAAASGAELSLCISAQNDSRDPGVREATNTRSIVGNAQSIIRKVQRASRPHPISPRLLGGAARICLAATVAQAAVRTKVTCIPSMMHRGSPLSASFRMMIPL